MHSPIHVQTPPHGSSLSDALLPYPDMTRHRIEDVCGYAQIDRRHRVMIPDLPQAAWRLLLELLQFDRGFCNTVIPYFQPLGFVRVCIQLADSHTSSETKPSMKAAVLDEHA